MAINRQDVYRRFEAHSLLSTKKRVDGMADKTKEFCRFYLGKYLEQAKDIGAGSIIRFLQEKELAVSTKYVIALHLGRFFYWNDYSTQEEYTRVVSSFRMDETSHRGDDITDEDVAKMLAGAFHSRSQLARYRDATILATLAFLGLRGGQVSALRLGDVGFEDEVLRLDLLRQKERRTGTASSMDIKKVSKAATLFGDYALYDIYEDYMDYRMGIDTQAMNLFLTKQRRPLEYKSVLSIIKGYGEAIGKDICGNSFRRYVANRVSNERGIHVARVVLGHKNISTTQRYVSEEVTL